MLTETFSSCGLWSATVQGGGVSRNSQGHLCRFTKHFRRRFSTDQYRNKFGNLFAFSTGPLMIYEITKCEWVCSKDWCTTRWRQRENTPSKLNLLEKKRAKMCTKNLEQKCHLIKNHRCKHTGCTHVVTFYQPSFLQGKHNDFRHVVASACR